MERRGSDKGVNAALPRGLDRVGADIDVLRFRAGEPADHRILRPPRDLLDTIEVTLAGDGEARLDDVDAHLVEQLGDFELLLEGHGGAGALLAVAHGGVENDDAVLPLALLLWVLVLIGTHVLVLDSLAWQSSMTGKPLELSRFLLPSPERPPRFNGRERGAQGRLRRSLRLAQAERPAVRPVKMPICIKVVFMPSGSCATRAEHR